MMIPKNRLSSGMALSLQPSPRRNQFTKLESDDAGVFANCGADFLRESFDFRLVLALDHHAREHLGTGVAHQQTPIAVETTLDRRDHLLDLGHRRKRNTFTHAHIFEHLRHPAHRAQLAQRLAGFRHNREHEERGDQAIAGGGMIREDHVTGRVADLGANQAHAMVRERALEAEIAHDGADDGICVQTSLCRHPHTHQRHHVVAVEGVAMLVYQYCAVAVAVERDTNGCAFAHDSFAQLVEMHRAAFEVDILAVRVHADCDDVGAEFVERVGANFVRRAIGAIDRDLEPLEGDRARHARLEEDKVAADRVVDSRRLADVGSRRARMLERTVVENQVLDTSFGFVVELEAFAREKLYAVIFERIVRRGDYDAGVGAHAAGQKRDSRCRQRPDEPYVDAHRTDSRRHRGLEHIARKACVLADQDPGMAPIGAFEHMRERAAKPERGFRSYRFGVGDTANAVRAKQSGPWVTQLAVRFSRYIRTLTSWGDWRTSCTPSGKSTSTGR